MQGQYSTFDFNFKALELSKCVPKLGFCQTQTKSTVQPPKTLGLPTRLYCTRCPVRIFIIHASQHTYNQPGLCSFAGTSTVDRFREADPGGNLFCVKNLKTCDGQSSCSPERPVSLALTAPHAHGVIRCGTSWYESENGTDGV